MRYWIRVAKQTLGPYTPEQIGRQSALTDDTLVCPEGSRSGADWRRLGDVFELAQARRGLAAPPPLAAESSGKSPTPPAEKPRDIGKLIVSVLRAAAKRK